jgi:hypothetical protein
MRTASGLGAYNGNALRRSAKPAVKYDPTVPSTFDQLSVQKSNWQKVYLFCNRVIHSVGDGPKLLCDFCIRKDHYKANLTRDPLKHKCCAAQ